jgi:hypothetical protein
MGNYRAQKLLPASVESSCLLNILSVLHLPEGRYIHGGKGRFYPQGTEIIFLQSVDLVGVYYAISTEIPLSEHDKLIVIRGPDSLSIDIVAMNRTGCPKFIQFGKDNHHAWYRWLHYECINNNLELVIAE